MPTLDKCPAAFDTCQFDMQPADCVDFMHGAVDGSGLAEAVADPSSVEEAFGGKCRGHVLRLLESMGVDFDELQVEGEVK